jgi:hypothetical protein
MPRANRRRAGLIAFAFASCLVAGLAMAAAIHGAIFTSDVDGHVNVNHYDAKADVYLNGGPTNDNCDAAAVDDGVYVFQITNPSGSVLLSEDDISMREFTVSGGVIVSANNHATVPADCGGVRVQMIPFADTPNNGGVYKAWITRKSDYEANGGFKPGNTKTDNFHVLEPSVEPDKADLQVYKFYDFNANGSWDGDEMPLFGWAMRAENASGFDATQLTETPDGFTTFSNLLVSENPYMVTEDTGGASWVQSASLVDGFETPFAPENPITGINLVAGQTTTVFFGNYCKSKSGGKGKAYWVSAQGMAKVNDGGTMAPEFAHLTALYLRRSDGTHFNLPAATPQATNWANLVTWLNSTSTTNMAYALSRNLAILRLNTEGGFVNNQNFYIPYGGTIAQLFTDANNALNADGSTPVGDPNRDLQAQLNTWIVAINNGASVVRAKPCPFPENPY